MTMPEEMFAHLRGVLPFTHAELGSPPQPFSEKQAAAIREALYPTAPLYLSRKSVLELMNEGRNVVIDGKEWRPATFYICEALYDQELPEGAKSQPDIAELKRRAAEQQQLQRLGFGFGIDLDKANAAAIEAAEAMAAFGKSVFRSTNTCEGPCSGKCGENEVTQDRKVSGDHVGAVSMANAKETANINPQARYPTAGIKVSTLPTIERDTHIQVRGMDPDEHKRIQDHYNESVAMAAGKPFEFEPARMTNVRQGYSELAEVLALALEQAQNGKGNARHQVGATPFIAQPICELNRLYGTGYSFGQAAKKAHETQQLESKEAKLAEILGGINYLAAAYIVIAEEE